MDKIDFKGKVAIVTGASSGIGAETAIIFAKFGAKLTLVGRNETRLMETVSKCVAENNEVPVFLKLDLTHAGSCETVVDKTVEAYGKIDILVNCAGKLSVSCLFKNSMKEFDELMNINFRVPYYLTKLVLPHLIETKGNIVNVGSSMSKRSPPGLLAHTVTKASIQLFSQQAAFELAPKGVRINSVSPGYTKTNILKNLTSEYPEMREHIESTVFTSTNGKVLDPKEVAFLICLTASDVFPNLNGSDLLLDGAALWA